jgi:ATP-dependent Clp protease, protease subunit
MVETMRAASSLASQRTIVFSGPIQHNATRVLTSMCCAAVNDRVTDLTILISSDGGSADEGFFLYEFLRALPLDLTIHNVGQIGSMANVVFLAGRRRLATPNSIFFFSSLEWTYPTPRILAQSIVAEPAILLGNARERIKSLFKLHTQISQAILEDPEFFKEPIIQEPAAAKAAGIIHEIQDAALPFGGRVLNADWS